MPFHSSLTAKGHYKVNSNPAIDLDQVEKTVLTSLSADRLLLSSASPKGYPSIKDINLTNILSIEPPFPSRSLLKKENECFFDSFMDRSRGRCLQDPNNDSDDFSDRTKCGTILKSNENSCSEPEYRRVMDQDGLSVSRYPVCISRDCSTYDSGQVRSDTS